MGSRCNVDWTPLDLRRTGHSLAVTTVAVADRRESAQDRKDADSVSSSIERLFVRFRSPRERLRDDVVRNSADPVSSMPRDG